MVNKPPNKKPGGKKNVWTEFECPQCTAHNPWDNGFTFNEEIFCSWCGAVMKVKQKPTDKEDYKLVLD